MQALDLSEGQQGENKIPLSLGNVEQGTCLGGNVVFHKIDQSIHQSISSEDRPRWDSSIPSPEKTCTRPADSLPLLPPRWLLTLSS